MTKNARQRVRENAKRGERTFALTADVSEAHRQRSIDPRDRSPVFLSRVGTSGVALASYFWSRVASALGRHSQYLTSATTWHQSVADGHHPRPSQMYRCMSFLLRDPRSPSVRPLLPLIFVSTDSALQAR